MSTALFKYQFDTTQDINYLGSDPEYWPDSGPVVVPEIQTPRISAYDLDALELASNGKLVLTTAGTSKALEVSSIGVADSAVMDTTVLDSGTKKLEMKSNVGTTFASDVIGLTSSGTYYSTIGIADPADPTFHHYADSSRMSYGIGVLDENKEFTSGAWLETTATSFNLRHDNSSISSETGVDSRIEYAAVSAHEFFVGGTALTQGAGAGAVELRADKITIRKDVDLLGNLNSIATTSENLQVEDQIIRLAHTDDAATANKDSLLVASKTGITIDTVPGSYTDDGTYMSKFVDSSGTKLFVDDDAQTIDVQKALDTGLFTKEVAFYLNQGAKASGGRDTASRLDEPYWQLAGGAMHLSHTVPNGNGAARKFSLGFRIADDGSMEMVRLTRHLTWDDASTAYIPDTNTPDGVKVLARYVNPTA